jgi:hypothetical protein
MQRGAKRFLDIGKEGSKKKLRKIGNMIRRSNLLERLIPLLFFLEIRPSE